MPIPASAESSNEEWPVAKAIRERRTVRRFSAREVPTSLLIELLNISVWAPNHGNRQPWRFILFTDTGRRLFARSVVDTFHTDEQKRHRTAKLAYYAEETPAHLVVALKEDPRPKQREEDFAAISSLIQNFQLAAWERGLGVVWKTNHFLHDRSFRERVGVGDGETITAVLHIGYPAIVPLPQQRVSAEQLITVVSCDTAGVRHGR